MIEASYIQRRSAWDDYVETEKQGEDVGKEIK